MAVFGPPGRGDRIARTILLPLAVLLVVVYLVFWVIFSPVRVQGDSMLPGLEDGDRVLATRTYSGPRRGDVIEVDTDLFAQGNGGRVLKRVIAVGGDTVRIDSGRATVNGRPEPSAGLLYGEQDVSVTEITIPQDSVYVLGDNRPISLDSRFYGAVPLDAVKGRLLFRYTPITRLGRVD
ncbi:MAG: signal peptidase I [Coriobacteriia bacterium]|jgi:signal peptidase I|nr:signal peptidase I [Coriobacteriia bacterium]